MATLNLTNVFAPSTLAESSEVNQNMDEIESFINTQVMHRDASSAFTAVPSGPAADPVSGNQLTRKAYVDVPFAYSTLSGNLANVAAETVLNTWSSAAARGITATVNGFTIVTTRLYMIGAAAAFGTSAGGSRRDFRLRLNGAGMLGMSAHTEDLDTIGFGADVSPGTRPIALTAGDTIDATYLQNSGGALSFNGIIWLMAVPGL